MRFTTILAAIFALGLSVVPALSGSVGGTVSDAAGNPLAGVSVEAIYQTYNADDLWRSGASIKASGVSAADGRYQLDLTRLPPGEYRAHAYQRVINGGRLLSVDLVPDNADNFVGNAQTVRNFTAALVENAPDLPYGNAGIFLLQNAILDYTDLGEAEVSLVHVESGNTLTRKVRLTGEGLVVTGIAFGHYRASVMLDGAPLQLRLFGSDPESGFTGEVFHDFTMGHLGNQFIVEARR